MYPIKFTQQQTTTNTTIINGTEFRPDHLLHFTQSLLINHKITSEEMIRSASDRSSSSENLPPRTIARVAREVRDLLQSPPEGTKLIVDPDTGLPSNLGELKVNIVDNMTL
jgi:hypothetical protein